MPQKFGLAQKRSFYTLLALLAWIASIWSVQSAILWTDSAPRVIHETPAGPDLLAGKVKRDDSARDELFFKFHVDPLSDVASEPYYALFQLFEAGSPRLGVGNAPDAWGYSACYTSETGPSNRVAGEYDLKSAKPEAAGLGAFKPYELPQHGRERTIIFKVQYVPGGDDLVTVWLEPDLSPRATDKNQPEVLTTKFKANASFDQIQIVHHGGGNGWIFSDMAIATSFTDFIIVHFWQTWWFTGLTSLSLLAGVALSVRLIERRKYQFHLRMAEQERALERERSRIAQDLHDDLGSSLARISLLSGLARADAGQPAQLESHVQKIAETADQTVRALEEIVWAVRPGSDSLQSLVEYIAHFSTELFDGNSTRCRLDLPADLPAIPLPPDMRHNTFLVLKEALTNVLKHAGAREVHLQAKASSSTMEFVVQDDGIGFDPNAVQAGAKHNGLSNMRRRAATMGAHLSIERPPRGTIVRLVINVPPANSGIKP
jgi:Signal transduction histidine kinase